MLHQFFVIPELCPLILKTIFVRRTYCQRLVFLPDDTVDGSENLKANHRLDGKNPVNNGIAYQPQLVS